MCTLVTLVGAYWYASLMATVSVSLTEKEADRHEYRSRIGRVLAYARVARLPPALRSKLLFYYEVCFPSGAAFDEKGFLAEISRPLRRELCLHKCGSVLLALHVSALREGPLAASIVENLQRKVFVAGDVIIELGLSNTAMYFVAAGNLEVLVLHEDGMSVRVATLSSGDIFGEASLLKKGMAATASVRVLTYCEAYVLDIDAFAAVCADFPQFKAFMQRLVVSRAVKNKKATTERAATIAELGHAGELPVEPPASAQNQQPSDRSCDMLYARGRSVIRRASIDQSQRGSLVSRSSHSSASVLPEPPAAAAPAPARRRSI